MSYSFLIQEGFPYPQFGTTQDLKKRNFLNYKGNNTNSSTTPSIVSFILGSTSKQSQTAWYVIWGSGKVNQHHHLYLNSAVATSENRKRWEGCWCPARAVTVQTLMSEVIFMPGSCDWVLWMRSCPPGSCRSSAGSRSQQADAKGVKAYVKINSPSKSHSKWDCSLM